MSKPLSGVRILDLSQLLAGPYGTMILGDLGAEVIKVERPGQGDTARGMPPHFFGGESAYYLAVNRNKRSMTLDLKDPRGKGIFLDLVRRSDVVYDNFRPGVMQRLGLDYAALCEVSPRIICCSVSGFGANTRYRDRAAFDLVIQAMGGIMSFTGEEGGRPVRMGVPMGDLGGGLFAAHGILAALYQRERTGMGQQVDISLLDCQLALLTYRAMYYFLAGEIPKPIGTGHVSAQPIGAFRTRDQEIVLDANTEAIWRRLCQALERPDLAEDPRFVNRAQRLEHKAELHRTLQEVLLTRTAAEWINRLNQAGVPAGPINTLGRILDDPYMEEREMVTTVHHPVGGPYRAVASPIHLSGHPAADYGPPPLLGQHTAEVLQDLLDYTPEQVAALREDGVL